MLACKTPVTSIGYIYRADGANSVYLHIHLGAASGVLYRNTTFRMPFSVHENPKVREWEIEPQSFKVYSGETSITIQVRPNVV